MENQTNPERSVNDQADGKFDNVKTSVEGEEEEQSASTYNSEADSQVRATEDASLQDDTYSFDEDNTQNEDIHDVSDFADVDSDLFDNQDDLQ